MRRLDAKESHATKPAGPHRWQGARPLELSSTYASQESSIMDDAGLPPQTEDECVEVDREKEAKAEDEKEEKVKVAERN